MSHKNSPEEAPFVLRYDFLNILSAELHVQYTALIYMCKTPPKGHLRN